MAVQFRLSHLVPPELAIESVSEDADTIIVRAKAAVTSRACPRCGALPAGERETLAVSRLDFH